MKERTVRVLGFALVTMMTALAPVMTLLAQTPAIDRYWPQWRGPHATGVSRTANPPIEWSETKNIRWKTEIPGRGSSTPVIWGDRIFLLTALPMGLTGDAAHAPRGGREPRDVNRYIVLAIDRRTGRTIWERTAREERPHEGSHGENGTWASSSAITDGEHVLAFFESQGLYAYDMDGKLLWQKDFGDKQMRMQFGEGSTPALYGHRVVVCWDHRGESFIVALDKRTGEELWRAKRDEVDTWSTPLIVEHAGRAQVITNGERQLRSYDLETGDLVWHSAGTTMNPIPSPVFEDGLVFLTAGFRGNSLKAIRLADARGDITNTKSVVWTLERDTPYVPSPLVYDGFLYIFKTNSGLLSVFDTKTGTPHYQLQRLEAVPNIFASPVGAAGRVYIAGREGKTLVIRQGPKFEVLATNILDDGFDASPAVVDNELYLRGYKYLYSIGRK